MKLKNLIKQIENDQKKENVPNIMVGDTVRIGFSIQEGNKQRIQNYQGIVVALSNSNLNKTVTVRRIFQGIGMERIFPIHSPLIKSIEILRQAKVRRAKLYYLRNRVGKSTRLKEKFINETKKKNNNT